MDASSLLASVENKSSQNNKIYYYNSNFDNVINKFMEIEGKEEYSSYHFIYILYGIEKLKSKVNDQILEKFINNVSNSEHSNMILCDSSKGFKTIEYDAWYTKIKNNSEGIWIGKNLEEQQVFRISKLTKELIASYTNNYGFCIEENDAKLMKVIEFNNELVMGDDEDEQ